FPALRRLLYRNSDHDLASIESLIASLQVRPRAHALKLVFEAEDTSALLRLAADPEMRARARGREAVSLLWDVCRIPDFKKLLLESHVALLGEIYQQLTSRRGVLDEDWMGAQIAEIDEVEGDIDTLIGRIASVRIWTYISHQARWIERAVEWQEQTRAIEDRLSDALHDRLVARFVERGAGKRSLPVAPKRRGAAPTMEIPEPRPSNPFAQLESMRKALAPQQLDLDAPPDRWIEAVIAAPHERFRVDEQGRIHEGDRPLGQLGRGRTLLLPEVKLIGLDTLGPGARSRLLRRLLAFARDLVEELFAPLRAPARAQLSAAGRGVVYQLEQGLGTVLAVEATAEVGALGADDRALLATLDVEVGERVIFVKSLLSPAAIARRMALCTAHFEGALCPVSPRPGALSMLLPRGLDPGAFTRIGYPVFGTRAIRADLVERFHQALSGEDPGAPALASLLGCTPREVPWIAQALGAG
ncbi:MAG: helicase, partial [Minicystis sp.]